MPMAGSWLVDIIIALAVISAAVYYYIFIAYSYWTKKNVPQMRPYIPLAKIYRVLTGKATFIEWMEQGYKLFRDNGFGGIYNLAQPVLLLCDPELIKQVLTKDFASFPDHGFDHDPENDPLSANLFNVTGERWKKLRAKMTPTFTSVKIKAMFPLINECVEQLQECVRDEAEKQNRSVEMLDLLLRYCADVIGSCAFGINCNCLKNRDAEFQHMGREMQRVSVWGFLNFVVLTLFPKMKRYLSTRFFFPKTSSFFSGLMSDTVKYRRENKVERNDFVQLMMHIADEEKDDKFFNQDIMTAQATIFFVAGLNSIANQLGFCLHELALNPVLQQKVYVEVSRIVAEFEGKISYEAVQKMDLVARVLDEGLRKYPPNGFLVRRQATERYTIPGTEVVTKKGMVVMIPIQAIHNDEKYFPEPEKFDPDRFTEEAKSQRHAFTYLPFGEGPRLCIAVRFAKLELRLCLASLVHCFKFDVAPETDLALRKDKTAFGPTPAKGFWLRVTERKKIK